MNHTIESPGVPDQRNSLGKKANPAQALLRSTALKLFNRRKYEATGAEALLIKPQEIYGQALGSRGEKVFHQANIVERLKNLLASGPDTWQAKKNFPFTGTDRARRMTR